MFGTAYFREAFGGSFSDGRTDGWELYRRQFKDLRIKRDAFEMLSGKLSGNRTWGILLKRNRLEITDCFEISRNFVVKCCQILRSGANAADAGPATARAAAVQAEPRQGRRTPRRAAPRRPAALSPPLFLKFPFRGREEVGGARVDMTCLEGQKKGKDARWQRR